MILDSGFKARSKNKGGLQGGLLGRDEPMEEQQKTEFVPNGAEVIDKGCHQRFMCFYKGNNLLFGI